MTDTSTNDDATDAQNSDELPTIVEHAGVLEDDDGVEHVVLMDQSGYAEVRTVDDDRWGRDWKATEDTD